MIEKINFRVALLMAVLGFQYAGLANAMVTAAQINTGIAGAPTGTAPFGALPANVLPVADACVPGNSTVYTPGNDACGTDWIVRTNDVVTYKLQYVTNTSDTVTLVSVLPLVGGNPVADWALVLPPECSGAGSGVSGDRQTLTCVTSVASPGTQAVLPQATIRRTVANGTSMPLPATTASALGGGNVNANADAQSTPGPLTISAAPFYDVVKNSDASGYQNLFVGSAGPNGEPGYGLYFILGVRAPYGSKGLEALDPSGISLSDDLGAVSVSGLAEPARTNVENAFRASARLMGTGTGWASGNLPDNVGNGCFGLGNSTISVSIYDLPGEVPSGTPPERYIAAPFATCAATQTAAGAPILIQLAGTTWNPPEFPTRNISGTALPSVYENYVVAKELAVWIPQSVVDLIPAGQTASFSNTYGNISGISISGQAFNAATQPTTPASHPATGEVGGGTINDTSVLNIVNDSVGYFSKFYMDQCYNFGDVCVSAVGTNPIRLRENVGVAGQTFPSRVELYNQGTQIWQPGTTALCDKVDNTKNQVVDYHGLGHAQVSLYRYNQPGNPELVRYPAANADYRVQYGVGGVNGVGASWANDTDYAGATCAEDQSPVWYDSLAGLPGGNLALVTKIRIVMLKAVNPGDGLSVISLMKNLGVSPVAGFGLPAGTEWPVGTPVNNWGTASYPRATPDATDLGPNGEWVLDSASNPWKVAKVGSNAFPAYFAGGVASTVLSDTYFQSNAVARIGKEVLGQASDTNPNQVAAGSSVTYVLKPTLSSPTTGPLPATSVQITDVLPPGVAYVPGSASLAPTGVQGGTPAAGYTTLVWDIASAVPNQAIAPITLQVMVDGTAANGTAIPNFTKISSPADGTPDCSSTLPYGTYTSDGTTAGTLCLRAARRDLTISSPPGFRVYKSVSTPLIQPGEPFSYALSWVNIGSNVATIDLIDVLPYPGDSAASAGVASDGRAPATAFAGTVHLQAVALTVAGDSLATFWYATAAPASIHREPAHASNGGFGTPAGIWQACPANVCPVNATAVRMVSGSPATDSMARSFTLPFSTSGNLAGNAYTNDFATRGAGLVNLVTSNDVTVSVVAGSLGGTVYLDANDDGIDLGETGLPDVQVCLSGYRFGPDGADNNGAGDDVQIASSCQQTDALGRYSFTNLSSGRYTVRQTRDIALSPGLVGTVDGKDTAGSAGGSVSNGHGAADDVISGIVLPVGAALTGYNFGEIATAADTVSSVSCNITAGSPPTVACTAVCTNQGPDAALGASCRFTGVLPAGISLDTCPTTSASLASGASLSCSITFTQPSIATTVTAGSAATNDINGANLPTAGNNPSSASVAGNGAGNGGGAGGPLPVPMVPWWWLTMLMAGAGAATLTRTRGRNGT